MPAETQRMANTARMALGVLSGSLKMSEVPPGARESVRSMMKMGAEKLRHFTHVAESRK